MIYTERTKQGLGLSESDLGIGAGVVVYGGERRGWGGVWVEIGGYKADRGGGGGGGGGLADEKETIIDDRRTSRGRLLEQEGWSKAPFICSLPIKKLIPCLTSTAHCWRTNFAGLIAFRPNWPPCLSFR